jgi:hypothetical protein
MTSNKIICLLTKLFPKSTAMGCVSPDLHDGSAIAWSVEFDKTVIAEMRGATVKRIGATGMVIAGYEFTHIARDGSRMHRPQEWFLRFVNADKQS